MQTLGQIKTSLHALTALLYAALTSPTTCHTTGLPNLCGSNVRGVSSCSEMHNARVSVMTDIPRVAPEWISICTFRSAHSRISKKMWSQQWESNIKAVLWDVFSLCFSTGWFIEQTADLFGCHSPSCSDCCCCSSLITLSLECPWAGQSGQNCCVLGEATPLHTTRLDWISQAQSFVATEFSAG